MRHHLMIACCFAGACYHDSKRETAKPPQNTALVARGPDVSATIADPLGFLPVDSEVVLSLDADQLRQSELWRQVEPQLVAKAGPDLAMFKAMCGFDPLQAIHGLDLGMRRVGEDNPDGVLVVHGIDRDQMLACVRRLKGTDKAISIDADGVVRAPSSPQDPNNVLFQFVDASTAVVLVGPSATRELLDHVIRGGAPLRGSPAFVSMFQLIDTRGALWAALNGSGHMFDKAAALGVKPKAVFGSVTLTDGLAMNARLRLSTAQEATTIVSTVQGQIGAAKMFFDRLDVSADDSDMVIALSMTSSQLQQMMSLLGGTFGAP